MKIKIKFTDYKIVIGDFFLQYKQEKIGLLYSPITIYEVVRARAIYILK